MFYSKVKAIGFVVWWCLILPFLQVENSKATFLIVLYYATKTNKVFVGVVYLIWVGLVGLSEQVSCVGYTIAGGIQGQQFISPIL